MIHGWNRSITLRLTLFFILISSSVLLLLGILVGNALEHHFERQDNEILTGKLELVRHELQEIRSEQAMLATLRRVDEALVGHQDLVVVVVLPGSSARYATPGADFPESALNGMLPENSVQSVKWTSRAQRPFRGLATSIRTQINDGWPVYAIAAIDISYHEHFMDLFRRTLWLFVAFAAALTGLLGWVAVRRGLAPLQAIRRQADHVTANRLNARLSVASMPTELGPLAETLNAMLTRLEESFSRLSDFSSDLAHEFRTPVSNLLTQTQVTLSKPRTPEEYCDILASNVEEYERLSRMITDMLYLAKSDNGQITPTKKPFSLDHMVAELVEFYRLIAEDKNVGLSVSGTGTVEGDQLMIRRAVSNLLSNAIRHTPSGGYVAIRISGAGSAFVNLAVENSGTTIPAEHLPRLFDRFYRADASRHRLSDGSGLGLAITQSILRAHGGSVSVSSDAGITVFEISIPVTGDKTY